MHPAGPVHLPEFDLSDTSKNDQIEVRTSKAQRHIVSAVVVAILIYAAFAAYGDFASLGADLAEYQWSTFGIALLLSLLNYVLRGWRWEYYLKELNIEVPRKPSWMIFLGGFAFSVTPGKVGELLKSWYLRDDFGVPVATSAPIVVGERLSDFLALCVLLITGIFSYAFHTTALVAAVLLVCFGTLLLANPRWSGWCFDQMAKIGPLENVAHKLKEMTNTMAFLLKPKPLVVSLVVSVIAWGGEAIGLWLIVNGFGLDAPLLLVCFIYAATTLLGALSMLPGGLGVTEASMVSALLIFGAMDTESSAVAATILCRIATLWFAVAIGFVALTIYRRPATSVSAHKTDDRPAI